MPSDAVFSDPLGGTPIPLDEGCGRHFLYARFDPEVTAEGLADLGLDHIPPEQVEAMDDIKHIAEMEEVAAAYASKYVDMTPFRRFI